MSELKIELVGKDRQWSFSKREVRIGRDTRSDVMFTAEEHPMVSRNHALLSFEGERCWVEDLKTRGGTLLNGTRIERAPVSPGDIIRLSGDGPELRLLFSALVIPGKSSSSAQAESPTRILPPVPPGGRVREDAPTRIVPAQEAAQMPQPEPPPDAQHAPTVLDRVPDGLPLVQVSRPQGAPVKPAARQEPPALPPSTGASDARSEVATDEGSAATTQEKDMAHSESDSSAAEELTKMDVMIMEKKIGAMRNLVVALLVMVLILGGMLINQNRLIERNRQELSDLKKDAFEQLMPKLSQKAKDLDTRFEKAQSALDLMDGKIKEAEDRFVRRLNVELPGILDRELPKIVNKYIDKKMKEVQGTTPLPLP